MALNRRQIKTAATRKLMQLIKDPKENGGLIKKELKNRDVDMRPEGDNTVSKYKQRVNDREEDV